MSGDCVGIRERVLLGGSWVVTRNRGGHVGFEVPYTR